MSNQPKTLPTQPPHSGGENLEVMREARNYNRFLRNLVRRFAGNAETALDFGAGLGTFSNSLGIPPGQIHCVETDAAARELLADQGYIVHETLTELADASIDYVFTLNVLEHIEDDSAALDEIYRVLNPGGRLLIYVPAFMILYSSMDSHVGHHRRYRIAELKYLIRQTGFTVDRAGYSDALGFFATLVYKLFDGPAPAPLNPRVVGFYDRYIFPFSRLLSVPLARILGKNLFIVANRPESTMTVKNHPG